MFLIHSAGSFLPDNSITREQMAVILYHYAAHAGLDTSARGDLSSFTDASSVDSWAQEPMAWAVGAGLLKGSSGALNPLGTATRAEIAQVLRNFDSIPAAEMPAPPAGGTSETDSAV